MALVFKPWLDLSTLDEQERQEVADSYPWRKILAINPSDWYEEWHYAPSSEVPDVDAESAHKFIAESCYCHPTLLGQHPIEGTRFYLHHRLNK